MIQATQLRKGMCIKHDNELYRVVAMQHVTPGKGRGMVQAKIRSLRTGAISDHRFRSEDRVEKAMLDQVPMAFLYQDGDLYYFMNEETFEQTALATDVLEDAVPYLIENIRIKVVSFEGQPVGLELPVTVEMTVVETEPAIKGASVSNQSKPAKTETGLVVNVPPFIAEGDRIKIDTGTGNYVERVK